MSELERVNENPTFREYMSAEEDNKKIENSLKREWREKALAEGLSQGLKQGLEQGKESIIKKMLEKGMSIDEISELTDLEKSYINNIK